MSEDQFQYMCKNTTSTQKSTLCLFSIQSNFKKKKNDGTSYFFVYGFSPSLPPRKLSETLAGKELMLASTVKDKELMLASTVKEAKMKHFSRCNKTRTLFCTTEKDWTLYFHSLQQLHFQTGEFVYKEGL